MSKITNALKKKWGPLPAWVWLFGGGLVYYLYRKYSATANSVSGTGTGSVAPAAATPQPQTVLQPGESVYDPNTGALTTAPGSGNGGGGSSSGAAATDLTDAMNNLANAIATGMPPEQVDNGSAGSVATPAAAISTSTPRKTNRPKLTARGATYAPFGHARPAAKPGFTIKGLGKGFWEYVPKRQAKSKGQHNAQNKTSKPIKEGRTTRTRSATAVRSSPGGRSSARTPAATTTTHRVTANRTVSTAQQPTRARQRPRQPAAQQVVSQRRPATMPRQSPTRQEGGSAPRPSAPPPRTQRAPAPPPPKKAAPSRKRK